MKYKVYQFRNRKKDERGLFAIFSWYYYAPGGDVNQKAKVGQVKARTPEEAILIAQRNGIGNGVQLHAVELLPESRLVAIQEIEDEEQAVSVETPEE